MMKIEIKAKKNPTINDLHIFSFYKYRDEIYLKTSGSASIKFGESRDFIHTSNIEVTPLVLESVVFREI